MELYNNLKKRIKKDTTPEALKALPINSVSSNLVKGLDAVKKANVPGHDKDSFQKQKRSQGFVIMALWMCFFVLLIFCSDLMWLAILLLSSVVLLIYTIVWSLQDADNMKLVQVWRMLTLQMKKKSEVGKEDVEEKVSDSSMCFSIKTSDDTGTLSVEYLIMLEGPDRNLLKKDMSWLLQAADERQGIKVLGKDCKKQFI